MAKGTITVRIRIIGPLTRTLELSLLVRSRVCLFFICLQDQVFWRLFAYFLEETQDYDTRHMAQSSELLQHPTLDSTVLIFAKLR